MPQKKARGGEPPWKDPKKFARWFQRAARVSEGNLVRKFWERHKRISQLQLKANIEAAKAAREAEAARKEYERFKGEKAGFQKEHAAMKRFYRAKLEEETQNRRALAASIGICRNYLKQMYATEKKKKDTPPPAMVRTEIERLKGEMRKTKEKIDTWKALVESSQGKGI